MKKRKVENHRGRRNKRVKMMDGERERSKREEDLVYGRGRNIRKKKR